MRKSPFSEPFFKKSSIFKRSIYQDRLGTNERNAETKGVFCSLQLVPSYPRPSTYDFRTEGPLLEAAQLPPAQVKQLQSLGGTRGWSILLRLLPPPPRKGEL